MLKWAFEIKCPYISQDVFNNVIASGSLEMMIYLCSYDDISISIENSISQIPLNNKYPAPKIEYWDIVSWCLDNNYYTENNICTHVAGYPKWDLLKKCIHIGLVWEKDSDNKTYDIGILSAKYQQWDILKFAYETNQTKPLSKLVFSYIATAGNFEMLNWAVENKLPFGDSAFESLVQYMTKNKELNEENILHLLEWGQSNLTFDKNTICKFALQSIPAMKPTAPT
jgi:hypothetical protein